MYPSKRLCAPLALDLDGQGGREEIAAESGRRPSRVPLEAPVSGFVQVIEWRTSQIDEMRKFNEEWRQRFPEMGPTRVLVCADRDDEGRFLSIVEFPSYEEAMRNSADPATGEFAKRMDALSGGTVTFRNLDVLDEHVR